MEYESLPESEFLVMKMAEVSRIATVPNALIRVNESYAYITKRVDRTNGKMLVMEDLMPDFERIMFKESYDLIWQSLTNTVYIKQRTGRLKT